MPLLLWWEKLGVLCCLKSIISLARTIQQKWWQSYFDGVYRWRTWPPCEFPVCSDLVRCCLSQAWFRLSHCCANTTFQLLEESCWEGDVWAKFGATGCGDDEIKYAREGDEGLQFEAAVTEPELKVALKDSLEPVIVLLTSLFQWLKLKDEPFTVFTSATSSEMDTLDAVLRQIQPDIDPLNCTLPGLTGLKQFLDHCCQSRHYSFSILKCGSSDCDICKPPRLSKEVFESLHHIPDPVRDGNVYKPFSEVYGTVTTEKDRPSLSSSAEKAGNGMPFSPSGQFAYNVRQTVVSSECDKPRILYAARKLKQHDDQRLELALNDFLYTYGMNLQDCIPAELDSDARPSHIFSRVYIRPEHML